MKIKQTMNKLLYYFAICCTTVIATGALVSVAAFCYLNTQNKFSLIDSLTYETNEKSKVIESLEAQVGVLQEELDYTKSYLLSIPVKVTAYNPTKEQCDADPFITASLTRVEDGIIALSRDLEQTLHLKFGDLVTLKTPEGGTLGTFRFQDRMNKRWQRRVDIFMWEKSEAVKFGIKTAHMYIQRVSSETKKKADSDMPQV